MFDLFGGFLEVRPFLRSILCTNTVYEILKGVRPDHLSTLLSGDEGVPSVSTPDLLFLQQNNTDSHSTEPTLRVGNLSMQQKTKKKK